MIESWKQHYDEHLNSTEDKCAEGHDSKKNGFISTANEGNQPVPTFKNVKDAINQPKNSKANGNNSIGLNLSQ